MASKVRTAMDVATETLDNFCVSKLSYQNAFKKLYATALDSIYGMGNDDTLYSGYTYKERYAVGINSLLLAIKTYHDDHGIADGDQIKYSDMASDTAKAEILKTAKDHLNGAKAFVYRQRKMFTRVQFTDERDSAMKTYVDIGHLNRSKKA